MSFNGSSSEFHKPAAWFMDFQEELNEILNGELLAPLAGAVELRM